MTGDIVLLKNSARDSKKGDKMKPRWLGPYKVEKSLGSGVFKISNQITGKVLKNAVNQCRLKHFQSPSQTEGQTPSRSARPYMKYCS